MSAEIPPGIRAVLDRLTDEAKARAGRIDRRVIDDLAGGAAVDENRCTFDTLDGRCALDLDHDGNHEVFS